MSLSHEVDPVTSHTSLTTVTCNFVYAASYTCATLWERIPLYFVGVTTVNTATTSNTSRCRKTRLLATNDETSLPVDDVTAPFAATVVLLLHWATLVITIPVVMVLDSVPAAVKAPQAIRICDQILLRCGLRECYECRELRRQNHMTDTYASRLYVIREYIEFSYLKRCDII